MINQKGTKMAIRECSTCGVEIDEGDNLMCEDCDSDQESDRFHDPNNEIELLMSYRDFDDYNDWKE